MRESQDRRAVFLLVVLSLVLYANSLGNVFIFDDLHTISENLYIKDLRYLPLLCKGYYTSVPEIPKCMFRPFLMLTFAFNYQFSRLEPLGFHIINILIHFLNGVLLYSLLRFLKKDLSFGLALSLCILFIAHPINTEAVTYISCRSDLLVTLLVMLAFLFYAKGRLLFSSFMYILALLSKETALVFIFLVFAYDFLMPRNPLDSKKAGSIRYIFYMALLGMSIFYWTYRNLIFNLTVKDIFLASSKSHVRSFSANLFIQLVVSLFYLRLFLWPHPLNLHHAFLGFNSLFEPLVFFSLLAIMMMVVLIFLLRKRLPLIALGLAWYLICLIPKFYAVLNFPAMEHHFYLPGIGIYFILAGALEKSYLRFRRQFIYIACIIISIFTLMVWFRNYEWKNSFRFYKVTVKRDPNSAVAHNNLGIEYSKANLAEAAEREFRKALSLSKSVDVQINSRVNLSHIYLNKKRFKEAIDELNEALKIKSDYSKIYEAIGVVYARMDENGKAEKAWKDGLKVDPQSSGILCNMGFLYLEEKRLKDANECFEAAIKSKPDEFKAYFGLGAALEQESDIESAIKAYEKSVQIYPAYALSHYALGTLYAQRQNRRALWHLKEAVRLMPAFAEAHNNLAVLYASIDPPNLKLARQHARKAVVLGYKVEAEFLKMIDLPPNQ